MIGSGSPVAAQLRVAGSPLFTEMSTGSSVSVGAPPEILVRLQKGCTEDSSV